MRRLPLPTLLFTALLWATTSATASAQSIANRAAIDRAIDAVYPSLVRISVVVTDFRGGRAVNFEASGSGTIISPDGYVITNHHVAGRARRITCTLSDRQSVPADLVGTDPLSDIAILKLRPPSPRTFPAAQFGDSTTLRRGDAVLAMGSPRALSQSVTLGVVSNAEMTMPDQAALTLDGEDVGLIVRWIGHDAAIYPGNSGGPLVNAAGEIVGINEISLGLSGAIPSHLAQQVARAIITDGRVRRSWTGFDIQPMVSADRGAGALVAWVASDSPAASAGIRAGDVLVSVNDAPIDVRFAEQLPLVNQRLFGLTLGKPAHLTLRRGDTSLAVTLTPIERPSAMSRPSEARTWGLAAANLTPFEAREMGRQTTDGVRVVSLRPGGAADQAKPPLGEDDVITGFNGKDIRSLADFETLTREALGAGSQASVLVAFEHGREHRLTLVTLAGDTAPDAPPAEARKAWMAVDVQVLTPPLAERLGLAGQTGVRVTDVIDRALPIQIGDVILAIDGQPVRASASNDRGVFDAAIRRFAIGSSVTLTISRNGTRLTMPVTLTPSPALSREAARYDDPDFGFRARDLTDTDHRDPNLGDPTTGVLVDAVETGSWASLARLSGNDVILEIDGAPVANVGALASRMKALKARHPASVVLYVRRGIRTLFLEVEPAW